MRARQRWATNPRPTRRWRREARGFTLVELLLVLVIIGLLAAIVVPRFANRSEKARIQAAVVDVQSNLPTALDLYELDNGSYPSTAQGLAALVEKPKTPPFPHDWNGPYIRGGLPRDPWGHAYVYRSPCERPGCDYEIRSLGPDGIEGSDDDIVHPPPPTATPAAQP